MTKRSDSFESIEDTISPDKLPQVISKPPLRDDSRGFYPTNNSLHTASSSSSVGPAEATFDTFNAVPMS